MANEEQFRILLDGAEAWNEWRKWHQDEKINLYEALLNRADLNGADLSGVDLRYAYLNNANLNNVNFNNADLTGAKLIDASLVKSDLSGADLTYAHISGANFSSAIFVKANLRRIDAPGANFTNATFNGSTLDGGNFSRSDFSNASLNDASLNDALFFGAILCNANIRNSVLMNAHLSEANLSGVDLSHSNLSEADFSRADLTNAKLVKANFIRAFLNRSNLSGSDLSQANLSHSILVGVNITNATISNSNVYGISVWDLEGEFERQNDLIITPHNKSVITVDNIEVAQFVYLILNNKKLRDVLNTLTSKTVLILGRFAIPERKAILDALRNKLREYDLLPIVFDFDRPTDKDFTETIKTLAGMCYFVIADITNPKSSPLELQATVPDYQIPFVPIIQEGESPFAMMVDLQKKYDWVLDTISYKDGDQLIRILKKGIIDRAMQKHDELRLIKAQMPTVISASQFEE
jgi:uncharacterized protein YjbI with pentapeptide repeats